ncbi:MAG: D-glycero-alpha-D-manno-heptose-1,7-bisphosphate 7-phosphatase [Acidimicrobiales bacterium]
MTPEGRIIHLVVFDRDGTLVDDVPYNRDASRVVARDGAFSAVAGARSRGMSTAVITNQSGVARGLLQMDQVEQVNRRVDELFGAFDTWGVCPHGPEDGCRCRKPAPGLLLDVIAAMGVAASQTLMVGDRVADVGAARAADVLGALVPSPSTEPHAYDLADYVLAGIDELEQLLATLTRRAS